MSTQNSTSIELPTVGVYVIDPMRSKVSYSGRHMFGLGSVHATFTINSGEVRILDPASASTVTVSIDANSFASGNAKRDKDVRAGGLLDCATYPAITFSSQDLQRHGDQWLVNGTVTAHGTAVPTELTIERITHNNGAIQVTARAHNLDRYAFGVTGSKGMVGRHLDLELDIQATRA